MTGKSCKNPFGIEVLGLSATLCWETIVQVILKLVIDLVFFNFLTTFSALAEMTYLLVHSSLFEGL